MSDYDKQMKALTEMAQMQSEAQGRKARANTQSQMQGHLGGFMDIATAPVITQAEIMAKQAPQQQVPGGESWRQAARGTAAAGQQDYSGLLDRFNMQDKMTNTLTKYGNMERDRADRDLDRRYKEAQIQKTTTETGKIKNKGTPFQEAMTKKKAESFIKQQEKVDGVNDQIDLIDDALGTLTKFEESSMLGTGYAAELTTSNPIWNKDAQLVDRKLKALQLDTMRKMFAGMSKAIDSDAERKFFTQSQPSLGNDPETNFPLLLGMKSVALKQKAEVEAQKNYVESHNSLKGYQSPVVGHLTAVVDSNGEMHLVKKSRLKEVRKEGYRSIDEYGKFIAKGGNKDETAIDSEIEKLKEKIKMKKLINRSQQQ